jgi:hypothetical protein
LKADAGFQVTVEILFFLFNYGFGFFTTPCGFSKDAQKRCGIGGAKGRA